MACSQTRISYNLKRQGSYADALWLVLRRGLVTILAVRYGLLCVLWLALRRGLVTIPKPF